jgi:hypothetical protein
MISATWSALVSGSRASASPSSCRVLVTVLLESLDERRISKRLRGFAGDVNGSGLLWSALG